MKKSFLILLLPLLLAGCGEEPQDEHKCVDKDKDHLCDVCGDELTNCVDKDKDGYCDICGEEFVKSPVSISIKKQPNKTKYYVGDVFDPTGMVVNVKYDDKSYASITDYTYSEEPLKLTDKEIVISYLEFTAKVEIEVIEKASIDEQEYTATITLHGPSFAGQFTNGTNFDSAEKFEELLEYIDEQLEYYDLINKIECTKCATRKVNSDTYLQIGTGSAKNGFNEGVFNWSCKVKIYKVEIIAFNYSNPYEDWQTGTIIPNVDNMGHLILDDIDTSFEVPADAAPITKTIVKEYSEGANGFQLHSTGGRMLVSEMKITWRG